MDAADTSPEPPHDADAPAQDGRDDLLSTLEVIEEQPLAERPAGYSALHDELARLLESGPRDPSA